MSVPRREISLRTRVRKALPRPEGKGYTVLKKNTSELSAASRPQTFTAPFMFFFATPLTCEMSSTSTSRPILNEYAPLVLFGALIWQHLETALMERLRVACLQAAASAAEAAIEGGDVWLSPKCFCALLDGVAAERKCPETRRWLPTRDWR